MRVAVVLGLAVGLGVALPGRAADRSAIEPPSLDGRAPKDTKDSKDVKDAKESKEAKTSKDAPKDPKDAKDPGAGKEVAGAVPKAEKGREAAVPAAESGGKGGAAGAIDKNGKARGPKLLPYARPTKPPPPPPPKPGEGPPPPSPLTMESLKQDIRRNKDSAGVSPDAPARTKVEQMLAEMVKTRAALKDDATRLENLTWENAGEASAMPGATPEGVPGQPPPKNPLDMLAKALRGIKPDQAAPIVARIDRNLAATVLLKMPPVDAGKIMGALKPDVAAELATQIALRAKPARPGAGGPR